MEVAEAAVGSVGYRGQRLGRRMTIGCGYEEMIMSQAVDVGLRVSWEAEWARERVMCAVGEKV